MMNKFHIYARITVALVAALLTSQLLVQEVFLGATPNVRPDVADRLVEKSLALINVDNYIAFFRGKNNQSNTIAKNEEDAKNKLKSVGFQPTLVKGVYAKEIQNAALFEIRIPEVDWVPVSYTKADGEVIQLYIPRGEQPPPPGLF